MSQSEHHSQATSSVNSLVWFRKQTRNINSYILNQSMNWLLLFRRVERRLYRKLPIITGVATKIVLYCSVKLCRSLVLKMTVMQISQERLDDSISGQQPTHFSWLGYGTPARIFPPIFLSDGLLFNRDFIFL